MNQYEARLPLLFVTPYGLARPDVKIKPEKEYKGEIPPFFREFEAYATWLARFHHYGTASFEIMEVASHIDNTAIVDSGSIEAGNIERFMLLEVKPIWRWSEQPLPSREDSCP